MCGIFGYYAYHSPKDIKRVLDLIFTGLKRLEYRGYDSAGVAIDIVDDTVTTNGTSNGPTSDKADPACNGVNIPFIVKSEGKIDQLELLVKETVQSLGVNVNKSLQNQVGIAHTRWATHGPPSSTNSHPIASDPEGEFVVVHNGIITNYKVLKDFLVKHHNETFETETDTEVIPKLCKFLYRHVKDKVSFPKLVMEVLKKLEGAYALLIKSKHYPGELVACKRGSPMILGFKEQKKGHVRRGSFTHIEDASKAEWENTPMEAWIASDASAVVEHTKKVIVLEDNDVLHLKFGGYGIYNTTQACVDVAVPRELLTLEMEVEQIMKGGYQHFMQKEIHEQPDSLLQTMQGRIQFKLSAEADSYLQPRVKLGGLTGHSQAIRRSRRIMFVACGTSYHSCLAARQTMEEMCDIPVAMELASDLLDRACPIFRDDTCVFVSQSGETADTLRALNYAKERGALCFGITNTVGSALSRGTHCGVHQNAGYEIGVASTKAYTSQIVCITMVALALAEDSISKRKRRNEIIDELQILPQKVREALKLDEAMMQLANELKDTQSMMFFARGYNYATALEASLKIKEVALIHSEGVLAGEMKHGILALVDEHLPILIVATQDGMYRKMESVIQQLLARNARLYILCNEGDESMRDLSAKGCHIIEVPKTVDALQPVINIVPLQLLAYHLTVLRGHNVDQPRNLAKSVTVTEDH